MQTTEEVKQDKKREKKVDKEYTKDKAMKKLKRHDDAILCVYSPNGMNGTKVISASADSNFRVWSFEKKTVVSKVGVERPSEEELDPFIE